MTSDDDVKPLNGRRITITLIQNVPFDPYATLMCIRILRAHVRIKRRITSKTTVISI